MSYPSHHTFKYATAGKTVIVGQWVRCSCSLWTSSSMQYPHHRNVFSLRDNNCQLMDLLLNMNCRCCCKQQMSWYLRATRASWAKVIWVSFTAEVPRTISQNSAFRERTAAPRVPKAYYSLPGEVLQWPTITTALEAIFLKWQCQLIAALQIVHSTLWETLSLVLTPSHSIQLYTILSCFKALIFYEVIPGGKTLCHFL